MPLQLPSSLVESVFTDPRTPPVGSFFSQFMEENTMEVDVAVIGGGMAGTATSYWCVAYQMMLVNLPVFCFLLCCHLSSSATSVNIQNRLIAVSSSLPPSFPWLFDCNL